MIIFPDLPHVEMEGVEVAEEIILTLRTTSLTASCPSCGTASSRIQSRYTRTLRDLPSVGHPIRLVMHVRRFFCKKSTCAQKIFVERLPLLCHPHAQRTKRLQEALRQLGLTIGGQAGADVGGELGISGSRDTILRLLRQSEQLAQPEPHVIGLDDWAWKRGLRYGTLICDLERGVPIDVLSDRSVETVSAWLKKHPSIDTVSRDGSSEYASAIKKGAPQARQVNDRWHLIKNLAGCVSAVLAHSLAEIRRAEQAVAREEGARPGKVYRQAPTRTETIAHQARQAERQERSQYISLLRQQGMTSTQIAAQVGMPGPTVRRWLARGEAPQYKHHSKRPSPIDPYITYLRQRWEEGCHNGLQLWRELRAKGFKGSSKGIYHYLSTLSSSASSLPKQGPAGERSQEASLTQPHPLRTISVQKATWLFFRKAEELKEEEQKTLQLIRQLNPGVETAYQLVETFLSMARQSKGEQLEAWLSTAEASHLEAFESFTTSVQKDKDAVLAGLTLPWSNGPLEGNVNRLKLIKRSMYGRAEIDLLKLRVLYHSKKSQDRKNKRNKKQGQQVVYLKKSKSMKNGANSHHTTTGISKVA
ncbi:MAG TPA: ISL3 family transposase [Ktedonobacteraceae bacterium]|nr:ISL3 family transposase [Ktedonobacteraceae bacterium]